MFGIQSLELKIFSLIGLVCDTTKKSITVIWESGLKIKNTYRDTSAPFYVSDFF